MAAPIQKLARIAFQCFSRKQHDGVFRDQLSKLKIAINDITAKDLDFDPASVSERRTDIDAPVTYVGIWEDDVFSMGIFVIKTGGKLPMHDHPGMFGFCKVIHGSVHLKSFSEAESREIPDEVTEKVQKLKHWQTPLVKPAYLQQDRTFTIKDDCCFLSPVDGNIHEIKSVGGTAAFLDILAPPYNDGQNRDCHYMKEMPSGSGSTVDTASKDRPVVSWLVEVPQPIDYWCDGLAYTGPPVVF